MSDLSENIAASKRCLEILRDPRYSPELTAWLIHWLREGNAPVVCAAGRCLELLGDPAFDDLFAHVMKPDVTLWPRAVGILALYPSRQEKILPYLRMWLRNSTGRLERQCAVSLAYVLVERRHAGHAPNPEDIEACRRILERDAARNIGAMRLHLRSFLAGLAD